MNNTWNKLLEFETRDLVERFIKKNTTVKHLQDKFLKSLLTSFKPENTF